jgi:uncharacterized protein YkwD
MRRTAALLSCPLVAFLAVATHPVQAGPASAAASRPAAATAIRQCANRHRSAAGLAPLRHSGVLAAAARLHARNMVRHGFFDHTDHLGRRPLERVEIFDREGRFRLVGENIAAGYPSVAAACAGWMRSAGHRANILRAGYAAIGGGFARGGEYGRYYVQVFGG